MTGAPPARRRRRREPIPAAAALARFRRRAGGAGAGREAAEAALAWPEVVGGAAADHSVPVRRSRAGVLTVACSSAAWAHELSAHRVELTARLAALCPGAGVSTIRFAVADHVVPAQAPKAPPARAPAAPSAEERDAGAAAAAGLREPALRDLVARATAAAAARRRSP